MAQRLRAIMPSSPADEARYCADARNSIVAVGNTFRHHSTSNQVFVEMVVVVVVVAANLRHWMDVVTVRCICSCTIKVDVAFVKH